ncbi:DUF916 domain-containing protein [Enterococcus faecalis]|uniref:WxL protein peptidoglycan domain-containing protein n=1 Tax=Enterococcus faecalis TaxID=1351 RepID=UPI00032ED8B4|nr:DUF916 domain-containing protein [Enterococcus faecalis]EOJ58829.1 hypothetical protein WMM_02208 [Enterococcus faecalis EnGen0364]
MLKNKILKIGSLCFIVLLIWTNPTLAFAEGADYSVAPFLPKNQREETRSYYDVVLNEQVTLDLSFMIENLNDESQTFVVEIYDAATNKNNIIDYSDEKLKENVIKDKRLTTMVKNPNEVTVSGHAKEMVTLKVKTPKEKFDGYILGAIHIVPKKEEQKTGITNLFTRTIGVRLWGDNPDKKVVSDITDNKKNFTVDNSSKARLHYQLENRASKIEKDYTIHTILEKENDKKKQVINDDEQTIEFAPSSSVEREIILDDFLEDGKYKLIVETQAVTGEKFSFEYSFQMKNGKQFNPQHWQYSLLLLILAIVILMAVWLKKKRSKKEEEKENVTK